MVENLSQLPDGADNRPHLHAASRDQDGGPRGVVRGQDSNDDEKVGDVFPLGPRFPHFRRPARSNRHHPRRAKKRTTTGASRSPRAAKKGSLVVTIDLPDLFFS